MTVHYGYWKGFLWPSFPSTNFGEGPPQQLRTVTHWTHTLTWNSSVRVGFQSKSWNINGDMEFRMVSRKWTLPGG